MIDPKRTYRTRDGREVRIYAVDGGGDQPVHGAVKQSSGWYKMAWRKDGGWNIANDDPSIHDLIEVRPRIVREVWVNVYPVGVVGFVDRVSADSSAGHDRIACVRFTIDVEEGEGL